MNKLNTWLIWSVFLVIVLAGLRCREKAETSILSPESSEANTTAKFTLLPPEQTGVVFSNVFKEDYNYNLFTYEYMYNGCGVAVGDVNGDGLPDLYFSAAFRPNRLYLNRGNMTFLDVTRAAGVAAVEGFKTGISMADVNGDGRMDIYSCRTSKEDDGKKSNHMFINMGNQLVKGVQVPVFEDQTKKLGLDDNSNSNHGLFFDFDRDGDLDLFLLNHRIGFPDAAKLRLKQQNDGTITRISTPETPFESNRFYINENGRFTDHTAKAGLVNSAFGLSATAADINGDGWMDIYVANDFIEPDYVYINNKNGTFTDRYFQYIKHSSQNSMGADIADINNDGLLDIMVLDMKARDPIRYKELTTVMQYDRYNLLVQYGYGRQVGRNVLQLNNGNNTFSEIGEYAGVASTDWSWAPLIADFNNDGWKDMYITNGYRKDVTNLDYTNYFRDSIRQTGGISPQRFPDIYDLLKHIPEKRISNFLFINSKQLTFIDATSQAGMFQPSFSNGAAYADLDLDGDLDIIVNNLEDPVFIYRNDITSSNWLQIDIKTSPGNKTAMGTIADVYADGICQHQVLMSNRGFLSSSEPLLHFGLGRTQMVDSIILQWPQGDFEILKNVKANQRISWTKGTGSSYPGKPQKKSAPLFASAPDVVRWQHQENDFVDFKREKLMPYMLSAEGPCLSVGDVNGDKLEDIFAGNGTGFPPALLTQNSNGTFTHASIPAFASDASYEDCGSLLEDFDGDSDLDLVVLSGGNAVAGNADEYLTRLYLNDGKGGFNRSTDFPVIRTNAGAGLAVDYDHDGDMDLIIGGKSVPGEFPKYPASSMLRNDKGKFVNVTKEVFPDLESLGMISDIEAGDLDGDGKVELVFVGEWLPVSIFSFDGKKYTNKTLSFGLDKTSGWWKSVSLADIDGDGDMDIIAGNIGLNHRLHTSSSEPVTLITKDFDGNGSLDPIMCYYYQQKLYPYASRDAIISQLPMLKKKFLRYTPYASATINDVFSDEQLKGSTYLYAHTFHTTLFRNENKKFVASSLPYQVQLHPVFDIIVKDFNQDGRLDVLMAGNFLYTETETSEMDAGNGTLLLQLEDGSFSFIPNIDHGFWAQSEVRELKVIHLANGDEALLTGNNRSLLEINRIVK